MGSDSISMLSFVKVVWVPFIVVIFVIAIFSIVKVSLQRHLLLVLSKTNRVGKTARTSNEPTAASLTRPDPFYESASALFTSAELTFLKVLQDLLCGDYSIQGKVRLADIISPDIRLNSVQTKWAFRRISQKHVDFLICDKKGFSIIGVVELDDRSHFRTDRIKRDRFVDAALAGAGIPILHHPVKLQYDPNRYPPKTQPGIGDSSQSGRLRHTLEANRRIRDILDIMETDRLRIPYYFCKNLHQWCLPDFPRPCRRLRFRKIDGGGWAYYERCTILNHC